MTILLSVLLGGASDTTRWRPESRDMGEATVWSDTQRRSLQSEFRK